MTELPPGWSEAVLEDVSEIVAGQSPPGALVNDVGEGLPFFQGKAEFGDLVPTARKWTTNPARVAEAGDVLLSVRAPVGPTNLAVESCAIGRGLMAVRPSSELADRYLLWSLRATAEHLRSLATGSTFEAVTGPVVRRHSVRVAPLGEQERIVGAIEEAISKLEAGEAGLHNVRQLLKRTRVAVLAAAVAGRLVPQDPADTPAAKLLAEQGVILEDDPSMSEGWARATVGDLLDGIEAGKSFATLGRPAGTDEVGVIKVSAMTWGEFRPDENKAIPAGAVIDERWRIRAGDLLFSRANTSEYVGACVLVPHDCPRLILSDKSLRLVPHAGVDVTWLLAFLRSRPARAQIEVLATGTKESMRNISQAKLRQVKVPVPPPEEQTRIASELARQMSFIEACERSIDSGLEVSAALRRSVLRAAFDGRLVRQDPTDEPASMLLDRIRAERAAASKPAKRRTRATA